MKEGLLFALHHLRVANPNPAHLGNGADGVPALRQDLRIRVIEEADEA